MAFLSVFLLGIDSCANGPKVTVYVSNPNAGGMDYSDTSGNKGFIEFYKTDKFVCFTPPDMETMLNYCGVNKQMASQLVQ